jgi:hypothetical protein
MRSSEISRNYPVYSACILIGAFTLYTLVSSKTFILTHQYPLIFGVVALAYLFYRSIDDDGAGSTPSMAAILSLYSITAIVAFHPTVDTIFRSDDWIILSLFESIEGLTLASAKNIALFEMFGDIRFQPLAHFALFARHQLFGNNIALYHLLNIALHVLTGVSVFMLLSSLTRDSKLSFIGGLIFITLPSQFDTIIWTYHIYIIASTLAVLLALYLTVEYTRTKSLGQLAGALLLSLTSMLFYEPAIAAPAALLLIISGMYITGEANITRRDLAITVSAVAVVYAFYIGVTLYGLSLTRETHFVSFSDITTLENIFNALRVTAINLWESTFIKNIGITPGISIKDLVYLIPPKGLYTSFASLIKIELGLFLLALSIPSKKRLHIIAALGALAVSYVFIIALGRMLTNPNGYVQFQPRYQYFPNAVLLTAAGMLLLKRFQNRALRPLINTILFAMLFWNLLNVVHANNLVAATTGPLDYHYLNIKDFLRSNPSSRLRLDLTPEDNWKFYLGSDIAFDILFKERLTKFKRKATHIYDGESFKVNPDYAKAGAGRELGDFTVEWLYHRRQGTVQARPIGITGPYGIYPKISIMAGELLRVDMVASGGLEVHSFSLAYPHLTHDGPGPLPVTHMIVEKDDNVLCLAYNGVLVDKIELKTGYRQWNADGLGLYGDYFRGSGEPVLIMGIELSPDTAKRGCKDKLPGAIIAPEIPSIKKRTDKAL